MKAIILARVSDKKQDSNEAQVVRVSDYVKFKQLTVWKTVEIEESSTKGDREKFQEVIKTIQESKEPIALVVDTVDRLQRSFKESVQLDEMRKAGKLEIHFYRENLVINRDSNSSDLLRWDMAVMFARSYVLQLSDNVKRKFEQKRKNGEWMGKAPMGYKNIGEIKGDKDIVLDPDTAHLIRKMFELYATGNHSTLTLRTEMSKAGLDSSAGKPLALSMVGHILNNPFYYGEMLSKGKLYPHKYQPLISRQLFDKCQQVRKGWGKKPFQYASMPYIFRGLVRCKKCGCSMSPTTAKGKFIYYSCTNAKKDLCDKRIYIPEKDFLKPIYEVLEAFKSIPQAKIDKIVEGLRKSNESKDLYNKEAVKALQQEYNTIQGRLSRLTDLLLDQSITKEDYDEKLKEMKEKQYDINIQIEEHTRADENYYITASNVLNLAKNACELFKSSEITEKRAILNYLLQNCVANENKLEFSLRSPYNHILEFANQPTGLRG
jgi:site-specific DNA recombinase